VSELHFSSDFYDRWEHLISSIEITNVPIRFIKEIVVVFKNENTTTFDVVDMIHNHGDTAVVENHIEDFLDAHDDDIECVDFHINLSAIADEVEPKTNKLLD
jgi:hypothetical protein